MIGFDDPFCMQKIMATETLKSLIDRLTPADIGVKDRVRPSKVQQQLSGIAYMATKDRPAESIPTFASIPHLHNTPKALDRCHNDPNDEDPPAAYSP